VRRPSASPSSPSRNLSSCCEATTRDISRRLMDSAAWVPRRSTCTRRGGRGRRAHHGERARAHRGWWLSVLVKAARPLAGAAPEMGVAPPPRCARRPRNFARGQAPWTTSDRPTSSFSACGGLLGRVRCASVARADALVSVHFNLFAEPRSGAPRRSTSPSGPSRRSAEGSLSRCRPGALVEPLFLTNPDDLAAVLASVGPDALGEAVAAGVSVYLIGARRR
jgi:hypothetical protein